MKPDLLIVSATDFEVSTFLSLCPQTSENEIKTGLKIYSGSVGQRSYDLLVTGPGVFNTIHAMATYLATTPLPEMVIDIGIAGLFNHTSASVGDLAVATKEYYIHTGVQSDTIQNDPLPFDLIPGHAMTREGAYLLDEEKASQFQKQALEAFSDDRSVKVLTGSFITVSTITASPEYAEQLSCGYGAIMESMEGAACAHVCVCHGVSMVELRAASNYVGERDKSKWDMDKAVNHLGRALAACF